MLEMFKMFEPAAHIQLLPPVGHVQMFLILPIPTENYM